MSKLVSRSSMDPIFEKPKFRDLVTRLPRNDKELLVHALGQFLRGKQQLGCDGKGLDYSEHGKTR